MLNLPPRRGEQLRLIFLMKVSCQLSRFLLGHASTQMKKVTFLQQYRFSMAINLSKSDSLASLCGIKLESAIVQDEHNSLRQRTSVPMADEHCRWNS